MEHLVSDLQTQKTTQIQETQKMKEIDQSTSLKFKQFELSRQDLKNKLSTEVQAKSESVA